MRKNVFVLSLVVFVLLCVPTHAVTWEGVVPFNGYHIRNEQYTSSYLDIMTQEQKNNWSPSAEWWVCSTTSPRYEFYLNSETAPTQFLYLEGTYPKWVTIFLKADNSKETDRVATNTSAWTSKATNTSSGTYTLAEDYTEWLKTKYLYINAQSANNVVSLTGSITNSCRWKSVKVSTSPRRFYLYNAANNVFLCREASGAISVTSNPEHASLVILGGDMVQPMSIQFANTSSYLGQSAGNYSNTATSWTITPVNEGFYILNNNYYLQASASSVSYPKDGSGVNCIWKFITEEDYDENVAATIIEDNQCYVRTLQAQDYVTPASVSGGAGSVPLLITEWDGDFYTQAHEDYYVKFYDAGEIYLSVHLPASKYAITVWQQNGANSWVNVYSTAGTGAETVQYNGQIYRRVPNGHLDCQNDDGGVRNGAFYTRTKNITLSAEADYLIGLQGGAGAAFDQVFLEAAEPVFCDNCYQYLLLHNTDPVEGRVLMVHGIKSVRCDAVSKNVLVPDGPEASIGYTFHDWNTRADGRGMSFHVGDVITLPTVHTDKYKQMHLYATWEPDIYTITLNRNGGTADGTAQVAYGTQRSATYTSVTFASSLHLKGYYTAASGGQKVMNADGSLVAQVVGYTDRSGRWVKASDCTLYAQYGPLYTITYSSETAGNVRVLDDMGNDIPSGTKVVDGTVITLQARVNQAGYQVWQWNVNGNVTTTNSGLKYVTINSNTTISVTYTTRTVQDCYNAITVECEDALVDVPAGNNNGNALAPPSTLKVAKSPIYVTGWTGNGYVDFDEATGSVNDEFMAYMKVNIPVSGNYQVTTYGCNGGNKYIYFFLKDVGGNPLSSFTNAVQVGSGVYYQQATQTLVGRTIGDTEWGTVMKQYPISSISLPAGEYIIGLQARKQAKFDRIDFRYLDSDEKVFCYDKEAIRVNSLPWSVGQQLDYGDTLFITSTALSGCFTKATFNVMGMDGDLFKVITKNGSNETVLMDNLAPGTYTLALNDELRTNGFMIVGVRSVSLGDKDNVIYGDTKGHDGIFVDGTTLYDANGVPFVMRGTNVAHVWYYKRTMTDLEAIASHGANTVRVVLGNGIAAGDNNDQWGPTTAAEINQIINKCEELGLVCVLEVHNTTGKDETSSLSEATNYWIRMKNVLLNHEKTVIINIGNEWMDSKNSTNWANAYKLEVAKLRAADLHHCIMIDADGYGQGYATLKSDQANEVLLADPDRNIVFSLHMYNGSAGSDGDVRNNINNVIGKGLCLVIGEYGWAHKTTKIGNTYYSASVKYQTIISHTNEEKVGALSWSWFGNSGGVEYLDMVDSFNNFIAQDALSSPGIHLGPINWGQYIVDNSWNWAGKEISTTYKTSQVLQVRSVVGEMDLQDYVVWDDGISHTIGATGQLSIGPEHFSSAEAGDELMVYAGSMLTGATGKILKATDYTELHSYPFTEENYSHIFTDADLVEAKEHGLVIRGQNYSIESVEIHARGCHAMREKADTLKFTSPLKPLEEYKNTFEFGDWEHTLVFTPTALSKLEVGDVIRVRVNASIGFTLSECRVAFRTYSNTADAGGITTTGEIGYTSQFSPTVTNLGGGKPDRAGFVDLYIADNAMLTRIKSNGLVIFGKNARLRFFMFIHDKFVIPADSAALVPACGIDTLVIYQGGQAINQEDFQVYKQIQYVRNNVGTYSYCTFNDLDAEVTKGAGGTYTNNINQWYTFTTPFNINQIEAYDEDGYWDINPVWNNGGANAEGYFYLEYLSDDNPTAVNDEFRARWTKVPYQYPRARVPYIILFSNEHGFGSYFEDNPITTYTYNVPAGSPLLISGRQNVVRELPESGAREHYIFENNTLYDMTFDGASAYILDPTGYEFVLTDNPVVHPFECYVQATSTFKASHPRFVFRQPDGTSVPTGVEEVDVLLLLNDPNTRAYDIMGRLINPQDLPRGGVYILVNGNCVAKIIRQ